MTSMIEAHFSGISSQSSVYGLTSLLTGASSHKVLMASSKRKVYCVEYSKNKMIIPSTREVQFTYIPGGAEIISIDAFNQACQEHDFVVGITFVKSGSGSKRSQYFNIYSDWEPSNECVLDNIAQGCLSINLDFIPFHLTHTQLEKETVWLLSGSDHRIHCFCEDKSRQTYCEQSSAKWFPEFEKLESVVLWMDFMTNDNFRITALGCKDGHVIVSLVKLKPEIEILSCWRIEHDGPISAVRLFRDSAAALTREEDEFGGPIHLAVANTLEASVVYRDVLQKGLSSQWLLPGSECFDCATCCLVDDIDMDGTNELVLGTYGQQVLVYKWQEDGGGWRVTERYLLPGPLLALAHVDITGDGLKELLLLTTRGLHILQHDLEVSTKLCVKRMKALLEIFDKTDVNKILADAC